MARNSEGHPGDEGFNQRADARWLVGRLSFDKLRMRTGHGELGMSLVAQTRKTGPPFRPSATFPLGEKE